MSSTLSEDWPQGSAEYLSTKLSGPDHSCPHPQKLKAGLRSKIPKRLGFFAVSGDDLSYIDTEKLCQQCYDQAVPNGFLAWSTTYRSSTLYHGFFPGQSQAGTERFGSGPRIEVFPQLQRCHAISGRNKVDQILGCGYYDPRLYESRSIPIPGHESLLAWRYLRRMKQPFYIDLLHLQPPWRGGLSKKDQRNEDLRVARNNGAAYLGAAGIVNAVPEGGNGAFTASEHRIAEIGSYRLISLGLFESDAAETQELDGQCSDAQSRRSFSIGVIIIFIHLPLPVFSDIYYRFLEQFLQKTALPIKLMIWICKRGDSVQRAETCTHTLSIPPNVRSIPLLNRQLVEKVRRHKMKVCGAHISITKCKDVIEHLRVQTPYHSFKNTGIGSLDSETYQNRYLGQA